MTKPLDIDELISRVRRAAWQQVAEVAQAGGVIPPPDTSRLNANLEDAMSRIAPRTKFPDKLNRFPLNRIPKLQKAILKGLELVSIDQRMAETSLAEAVREQSRLLREQSALISAQLQKLDKKIAKVKKRASHKRAEVLEREVKELRSRLLSVESAPGLRAPEMTDADYAEFEEQFRGPPENIKQRQTAYVEAVRQGPCGQGALALDLGTGRGEWLSLLKENGIAARGVDLNHVQVERCRAQGLEVEHESLLPALRAQADASLGAVTAFQVVEHLQFGELLQMLSESARVLKPGGVAIFETPNAQSLFVLANTFYLDPSHVRPVPAPMLEFFARRRGFGRTEIRYANPRVESRPAGRDPELDAFLEEFVDGAQDYALVAWK